MYSIGDATSLTSIDKNDIVSGKTSILITGGAGYIGSVLTRILLEEGHHVTVYDKMLFGNDSVEILKHFYPHSFELVKEDIRNQKAIEESMEEKDAIVHLAAIVGDPACSVRVQEAVETNYEATKAVASQANELGVPRLLFASTCSVYGASEDWLDEESETNPLSVYGRTKVNAERFLLDNHMKNTDSIVLRLGTIFGLSPRMRFDLVVNHLARKAVFDGKIKIFGGGQWRPFVHVRDVAQVFFELLSRPTWSDISAQVYNVGFNESNYMLSGVARSFQKVFPDLEVAYVPEAEDKRSYRVRFDKIHDALDIEGPKSLEEGVAEIKNAFLNCCIVDPTMPKYYNYRAWS